MKFDRRFAHVLVVAAIAALTAAVRFAEVHDGFPVVDSAPAARADTPESAPLLPPLHAIPPRVSHKDLAAATAARAAATGMPPRTVTDVVPPANALVDPPASATPERVWSPASTAAPPDDPRSITQHIVCRADTRGPNAVADAIQDCIDHAPPYSSVEIPPGRYVLHRQLVIASPLTLRTSDTTGAGSSCTLDESRCAVFVAGPDLIDQWGPLLVWSTNGVALEHIVLDGNRDARATSAAARWCLRGDNTYGFNATVLDCAGCSMDDVVSQHALCGSGMVWTGGSATIQRSAFRANGNAATSMWSDGLTLIYGPGAVVTSNQFVDNSDVAFIIGYGVNSRIEKNVVVQQAQPAFAGIMLHNFGPADLRQAGDFRGAMVQNNVVDCGPQLCVFGIQVGPNPWNSTLIVIGGDIHGNEVRGAKVGINVDGGGVPAAPVVVHDNLISAVPQDAYFADCAGAIPTEAINISPTSTVDRGDDTSAAGALLSKPCELSSSLAAE